MKNIFSQTLDKIQKWVHPAKRNERLERGQVLVIVTLSVIALTAIVGLTVDVGLLYLNHGKLRRAVDAAALSASSQFREGYSSSALQKSAEEFLVLNGINDPSATVETCATTPGDPVLCTTPARKLVRVRATEVVRLTFLSVIGINQTTITAQAVSEAASMDVVLVIDKSDSMTYDAPAPVDDPDHYLRDPSQCNPGNDCEPFKQVKEAAAAFVDQLYFPYDRVAIVTFADQPNTHTDLSFSDNKASILGAINGLGVVDPGDCLGLDGKFDGTNGPCRQYEEDSPGHYLDADGDGIGDVYLGFDCPIFHSSGDPKTCGTTSIGRGLELAGIEFGNPATFRQEALWVVILLTDGAANGPSFTCPNNTWTNPYCRDLSATSRHCFEADNASCLAAGGVYWPDRYDADDFARDMADFVAEDQGSLIFTIGLGPLVENSIPLDASGDGAGEQLMKYAAETGGGSYYYAPGGNQLRAIFLDIASNLATRLTQ